MLVEIEFGTPAYDESIWLRSTILRKPLGLAFTSEELSREYEQYHLGYYGKAGGLLACIVLKPLNSARIYMKQIAVREDSQKQGIGSALVCASEQFVQAKGYQEMTLHARQSAISFYERLNYVKVGEEFLELGIVHIEMRKTF
jgi:ribosomal protein S18 acetylase RimI-like enzyme